METILVVEDEDNVRAFVRDTLTLKGYTVLDTDDPQQALRIAREHAGPVHLLLTDAVMPRMNGKELAERLEPIRPQMKVLFMSAYTVSEVAASGQSFIAKPFTLDSLAEKVRHVLGQRSPFARPAPRHLRP